MFNIGKHNFIFLVSVIVLGVVVFLFVQRSEPFVDEEASETAQQDIVSDEVSNVEIVAENLEIPWDITFLPSGVMLVTERSGSLVFLDGNGKKERVSIPDVLHEGEGGLLGLVLHPEFAKNNFLYLYRTRETADGASENSVIRYRLEGKVLTDQTIIVGNIPGARYHDGGRLAFGPDGMLYVPVGGPCNVCKRDDDKGPIQL